MLQHLRRWHVLALLTLLLFGLAALMWPLGEVSEEVPAEEILPEEVTEVLPGAYSPEKVSFAVQFKDEVNPYRLMSAFVMPGEAVEFEAVFTEGQGSAAFAAAAGEVAEVGPETWRWTAPQEPGLYPIRIADEEAGEAITFHAFVKVPFRHRTETLGSYRIGAYEAELHRNNPLYERPEGFIEVTPENENVRVSPHFTLGQFASKQESSYPKYLLLNERLLLKLEMLLEEVNDLGIEAPTFHVMSGFRTPFYNRAIGNTTAFSAHLYGAAADIFVDTNDDVYMDDLDGDGEVTVEEAQILASVVESLTDETWYRPFIGGLGIYGPAPHRGPFIHVDVRGEIARW